MKTKKSQIITTTESSLTPCTYLSRLTWTLDMGEKWYVTARVDTVIAGASDSSTNAAVTFNRRFGDNKALNLGYKYFVDDYDNLPPYAWDITQDGPIVGFT